MEDVEHPYGTQEPQAHNGNVVVIAHHSNPFFLNRFLLSEPAARPVPGDCQDATGAPAGILDPSGAP